MIPDGATRESIGGNFLRALMPTPVRTPRGYRRIQFDRVKMGDAESRRIRAFRESKRRKENRAAINAQQRAAYQLNREAVLARNAKWQRENAEKRRIYRKLWRARRKAAT